MTQNNKHREIYQEDPYFSCSTMIADYRRNLEKGHHQDAIDCIKSFQAVLEILPFQSDREQLGDCLRQYFVESPSSLRLMLEQQLPDLSKIMSQQPSDLVIV